MTLVDEIRQRRLQQQRRELPGDAERLGYPRQERWRQHHEAEAECREQDLGEAAEIDHPVGAVGALHGRDRLALEPVFAVEIVLDDPGIQAVRHVEQAQPLLHAHGGAQGVMAGRRHIDDARCRTGGRIQRPSVAVDEKRREAGARSEERGLGTVVSRLLDPGRLAGVEQDPRQQI